MTKDQIAACHQMLQFHRQHGSSIWETQPSLQFTLHCKMLNDLLEGPAPLHSIRLSPDIFVVSIKLPNCIVMTYLQLGSVTGHLRFLNSHGTGSFESEKRLTMSEKMTSRKTKIGGFAVSNEQRASSFPPTSTPKCKIIRSFFFATTTKSFFIPSAAIP